MQQNTNKTAMVNGLIIGAMLSIKFLLSSTKIGILAFIGFAISILIVFALYKFAINHRDKEREGFIKYWEAFFYVFQMYLYGSIILK